ncbi:MAG: hypothetical protein JKY71_06980 [Alphaproteobacteria bacterium]|nr:hypothetical protein [Alphaproteobacteria bacterium]
MAELALLDRAELFARLCVPYVFMAFLLIISLISVPYPLALLFDAPFLLMIVFYWSVFRPTLVPPLLVFAVALAYDLLVGMTLPGLSAVLLLVLRLGLIDQRRYLMAQGFALIWLAYAGVSLLYVFAQWSAFSLANFQLLPYRDFVTAYIVGIVVFPFVYMLIHITHKILPSNKDSLRSR